MNKPVALADFVILIIATFAALMSNAVDIQSLEKRVAKIEANQGVKNAK